MSCGDPADADREGDPPAASGRRATRLRQTRSTKCRPRPPGSPSGRPGAGSPPRRRSRRGDAAVDGRGDLAPGRAKRSCQAAPVLRRGRRRVDRRRARARRPRPPPGGQPPAEGLRRARRRTPRRRRRARNTSRRKSPWYLFSTAVTASLAGDQQRGDGAARSRACTSARGTVRPGAGRPAGPGRAAGGDPQGADLPPAHGGPRRVDALDPEPAGGVDQVGVGQRGALPAARWRRPLAAVGRGEQDPDAERAPTSSAMPRGRRPPGRSGSAPCAARPPAPARRWRLADRLSRLATSARDRWHNLTSANRSPGH